MSSEDRATRFVRRTNEALSDLDRADEIWAGSVRSTTEEIKLHSLSLEMDNLIRRVTGPFETWAELEPARLEEVRERGPINLMWVISAHPSGHVREAFVHETEHLPNERVLPHLANRSLDFVAPIRDVATPLVLGRLEETLAGYSGPDSAEPLPTAIHIALTKLLAPRTGMVSPRLMEVCIALATAAALPQPRRLKGGGMMKMLDRCNQTLDSATDPASRAALEALIAYFRSVSVQP